MYNSGMKNNKKINKKRVFFLFLIIALMFFAFGKFKNIGNYSHTNNLSKNENLSNTNVSENSSINTESKKAYYFNTLKTALSEQENTVAYDEPTPDILTESQLDNIQNIFNVSPSKTVYLTFDDGPSNSVTPLILDLLNQENIKATFFVLGTNVDMYPDIVQREYSEGHYIGNHGYSHKYSEIYQNKDTILNDYVQCNTSIQKALGNANFSSKVYRFPGGSSGGIYNNIKSEGKTLLKENNIAYLDWNALTCDAEGTPTRESILENLEKTVGNKDVVVLLMHDSSTKILTYETLPQVISFLRNNGYTFRTIYDVLQ